MLTHIINCKVRLALHFAKTNTHRTMCTEGAGSHPAMCQQQLRGEEIANCPTQGGRVLQIRLEMEGSPLLGFSFPLGETFLVPPQSP